MTNLSEVPKIPSQADPVETPDPQRELARNALREIDAHLREKILEHPELVKTLAWIDSDGRTPSPGFQGDLREVDAALADAYLVDLATKGKLPKTRVERVVGTAEPEVEMAKHRFEVLKVERARFKHERESTPEERVIIRRSIENINRLRAKHGLPPAELSPARVKMIESAALETSRSSESAGVDIPTLQKDLIAAQEITGASKFDMIQHELFHAGAYQSLQQHQGEGPELLNYRTGIEVSSRKKNEDGEVEAFLSPLNEAVTEEHARRFTLAISEDDPELGYIATKRKKVLEDFPALREKNSYIPNHPEDELLHAGVTQIDEEHDRVTVQTSGYFKERQAMWHLFDKIHDKNPDAFSGKSSEEAREAMFDMVTKASLDGNIMPFGRLMNETFGLGTFRNYGHLQTAQEIVALIDSLDTVKKQ